jgi:hypothetical protein
MGQAVNMGGGNSKDVVFTKFRFANVTETMAGNKTLTVDSPTLQFLDPTTARDVTLPAEADSDGLIFVICNTANAGEVITIKNDAAGTVCTPTQNESAIVFCDGTTWKGLVGASS